MSCITEILKLKGDKEIYMAMDDDGKPRLSVEGGGTYKDYEYLIVFTDRGHRCGYVAVPAGHKLDFVKTEQIKGIGDREYTSYDYDAYGIECHGGITFCKRHHFLKDLLTVPCNDLWLGFDCAHAYDGKDLELIKKYYGEDNEQLKFYKEYPQYQASNEHETVRSYAYVVNECRKVINQLVKAAA